MKPHPAGHGTHVASVLAGDSTGIAPGAALIGALALPGGHGSTEQVLAAMEWILDPDQDPQTDDGAQDTGQHVLGCLSYSEAIRGAVDTMIEIGVLPVGAIGNYGPGTSISPGNAPGASRGCAGQDGLCGLFQWRWGGLLARCLRPQARCQRTGG